MTLNRAEALAGVVISLALAILPVIGNFDWTSTAGCIGGIVAVLSIVNKRLEGWQKWEARTPPFHVGTSASNVQVSGWQNVPSVEPPKPPPLNVPPATPPGEPA